jgi:predicted DNA-binding transcriptional regulator AlpA
MPSVLPQHVDCGVPNHRAFAAVVITATRKSCKRLNRQESPLSGKKHDAVVRLSAEHAKSAAGTRRPLLHVLMSDGRVSEFKGATVVIPEGPADEAEAAVYWVAINGKGEMFADEKGDPVIVEAPGLILGRLPPDPESYVSLRDIADWSGLSESTVERAVDRGDLAEPTKLSRRRNGYRFADVQTWLGKRKAS